MFHIKYKSSNQAPAQEGLDYLVLDKPGAGIFKMEEIWKDVKEHEGYYQVSNTGLVRSVNRIDCSGRRRKSIILSPGSCRRGYLIVVLQKDNIKKTARIHHLVWDHFGNRKRNGRKLQVDHIDENKNNNSINNLQLLTSRQNKVKSVLKTKRSSEYIGVVWSKKHNKWRSQIRDGFNNIYLGLFENEYDAHLAYQTKLKELIS